MRMPRPAVSCLVALLSLFIALSVAARTSAQQEEETRGTPAEPSDADDVRAQMEIVEALLPKFPDRGAALYFLAVAHQHLGESTQALQRLKECIDLREGFDASSREFAGLRGTRDFDALVEKAHLDFPPVSRSRVALLVEQKDLIPEGLAWDDRRQVFYLGSLNLRKIVQVTTESRASDFVPPARDHLLPVLGIRLDQRDGTIWAASFADSGKTELLHFDSSGKLLDRFTPPESEHHGFNDLVVRPNGEIILTDSLANAVVRFDPREESFSNLILNRPVIYPNGITLASDGRTLFVADALGVIRADLSSSNSQDVVPGQHSTLAGVDGLYWRDGSLIAIQNGIGSPRIAAFKLSKDGSRVARTTILEYRTSFAELPTTGAIRGSDFYFIANSQLDNLINNKIMDVTRLSPVRIAVVPIP